MTFVFLSTIDWDAPQFGSREQLALRLAARGAHVLFVDVPRALHSLVSDPGGTRRALGRFGRVRRQSDRLVVYTPWPVLPVYYSRISNAFNQRLLLRDLQRVLRRIGWDPDVLWTFWPNTAYLVGRLGRSAVYHCIDDFTAVSYPFVRRESIRRMEAELCRRADLVITRTEELATTRRAFNPNTHVVSGGVDTGHFDPARGAVPPADVAALPRPRVGLVGTVDDRIDIDALVTCARTLPGICFVLVGPVKRHRVRLGALRHLPNVHVLPARSHEEVPAVIAGIDVALIPYRVTPYTQGTSPTKLYEYLAMGKPVVTADLPYVQREAAHVRIARTSDEYVANIKACLSHPPTREDRARWRAAAEGQTWDRQVDQIGRLLAGVLERA